MIRVVWSPRKNLVAAGAGVPCEKNLAATSSAAAVAVAVVVVVADVVA